MKRTVFVATVVALATASHAATLTVFTTDASNVVTSTFLVGQTILLKVTGDAQGGVDDWIEGRLVWNPALTTTVSATQGDYFAVKGPLFPADGSAGAFNQAHDGPGPTSPTNQIQTAIITLVADATGTTGVTWGGTLLAFFDIYIYTGEEINIPTGHSFTIIPEPATAAMIGLGLIGLALGGLRAARN